MDTSWFVSFLKEFLFFLIVLGSFIGYGMFRGTQSLINVILGLYLGLLIATQFPYFDTLVTSSDNPKSGSLLMILVFAFFSTVATYFYSRIMPDGEDDSIFSDIKRKFMYASSATILVMIYSFNVLPVTDFITPGSPIYSLFAPAEYFFWWLLVPGITIYFFRN